jgi:hypothetical protein
VLPRETAATPDLGHIDRRGLIAGHPIDQHRRRVRRFLRGSSHLLESFESQSAFFGLCAI